MSTTHWRTVWCIRFFRKADVSTNGLSTTYVRDGREGRKLRFHFCPTCGTTVYWFADLLFFHIRYPISAWDSWYVRGTTLQKANRWTVGIRADSEHLKPNDPCQWRAADDAGSFREITRGAPPDGLLRAGDRDRLKDAGIIIVLPLVRFWCERNGGKYWPWNWTIFRLIIGKQDS